MAATRESAGTLPTHFRKPRPILQRAVEVARETLPDDAKGQLEAILTAARTTPLVWKVEPRK